MSNSSSATNPTPCFVPRVAQCSMTDGLMIGWIATLAPASAVPQTVVDILPGHRLSFGFVARNDVELIYAQFGTYRRKNRGTLRSRILDAHGTIVSESQRDLGSFEDNEYALLHDVRSARLVPGRTYTLSLESSGRPGEKIALWGEVGAPSGEKAIVVSGPGRRTFLRRPQRHLGSPARIGIVSSLDMIGVLPQAFTELREQAVSSTVFDPRELLRRWSSILNNDVILFFDFDEFVTGSRPDTICYALHRAGIVTVAVATNAQCPRWATACQYTATINKLFDNITRKPAGFLDSIRLAQILDDDQKHRTPSIAVLCCVGDQPRIARDIDLARIEASGSTLEFICILDEGYATHVDKLDQTFTSWSQAILAASQDILLLVGPEINITTEVVETHIFEHWYSDVEVVFSERSERARLFDASNGNTSVDDDLLCGSRVISLKTTPARLDLIEALSQQHNDFSGACTIFKDRLEARGAVVRKSELPTATMRREQAHNVTHDVRYSFQRQLLEIGKRWSKVAARPPAKSVSRRLKILSYRWHAAHQYEIFRLPFDFTLTKGFGNHITEVWPYMERPLRSNVTFRYQSEIDPREYDLCIIHFDENVLCPELSNGVLPPCWGEPFLWLLSFDELPKIAVCHGTPPFEGQYARDRARKTHFDILHDQRTKLVSMLAAADAFVVCNSWQAKREWGFDNSRVIWHGFDPNEFRMGSHASDVLTLPHDHTRPHYRGYFEQLDVERLLDPDIELTRNGPAGVPIELRTSNAFADRQYRAYVEHIGRFRFYVNTTLRSPMPRSRGEAMMTGVIPVSLANHDVELFIDNGIDGFYAERPEDLAEFVNATVRDKTALASMSAAARRKAIECFDSRRFQKDWLQLIEDRLGRKLRHKL